MGWSLFLTIPACLSPKPVDDSGSTPGDDSGTPAEESVIHQIRTGDIPVGEMVTVDRAVVSAPKTYDGEGLYIQDAAGGEYSGIMVWSYNGLDEVYVDPGDEVSVTGTVSDYFGMLQLTIDGPEDVVVTGTADLPTPADLGDGSTVTDWDAWEAVLVTLADQTILSVDDYGAGLLTSGVSLDDGIYRVEASCGDRFDALTGVVSYEYELWRLNPRWAEDAVGQTAGGEVTATVTAIQTGEACGVVRVEGVVATTDALEDEGDLSFFVQDAGGGPWSGMQVFVPKASMDVRAGDVLTLVGETTEYYGMTQLRVAEGDVEVTGSATPTVDTISAPEADWESREGCLVALEGITVTGAADDYGQYPTDFSLLLDDELYDHAFEEGTTYASVTGVVAYDFSEWKLWPRNGDDIVP